MSELKHYAVTLKDGQAVTITSPNQTIDHRFGKNPLQMTGSMISRAFKAAFMMLMVINVAACVPDEDDVNTAEDQRIGDIQNR